MQRYRKTLFVVTECEFVLTAGETNLTLLNAHTNLSALAIASTYKRCVFRHSLVFFFIVNMSANMSDSYDSFVSTLRLVLLVILFLSNWTLFICHTHDSNARLYMSMSTCCIGMHNSSDMICFSVKSCSWEM